MKVQADKLNMYVGDDKSATRANHSRRERETASNNGKSIKAKDLRLVPDKITEKKLNAQKKAWKIIADANKNESKIDDSLTNMQQKIDDLMESSQKTQKEIDQIHSNISMLQEEYGVSDDSQEQKDLELLMKQQDKMQGGTQEALTDEENERLANMGELTDYQTRALEYSKSLHTKSSELEQNRNQIKGTKATIDAVKVERGKSHGMVDAQVESNQILESAAKEAANDLISEAKDSIDDQMDKMQEEEKKKAEEKKAEEEKEQKAQEADEANKPQGEDAKSQTTDQSTDSMDVTLTTDAVNIQRKLSNILKDDHLLDEDLKGIALDKNL